MAVMMTGAAVANAADAKTEWWSVPPMSDEMRLADTEPNDGIKSGTVRIVAAKDKFEPASFVIKANSDLGKVQLSLSELKTDDGLVFPAENLDLKFVKVWYANKNGWFSYFGDTGGFKLIPELLVNDEDIIRVDTANEANYARLVDADGKVTEKWINPPAAMDRRPSSVPYRLFDTFYPMRPDFRDADTLQPVRLGKDEYKQFWLTAHITKDMKAGTYKGRIEGRSMSEEGRSGELLTSIPVEIKVLDYILPKPKCYVDPTMDFWVNFYSYISFDYIKIYNGGDEALAKKQLEKVLQDQADHGQNMHWFRTGLASGADFLTDEKRKEEFLFTFNAMKKAGMITKPLVGWIVSSSIDKKGNEATLETAKKRAAELDEYIGHHDVYLGYGDEPSVSGLVTRHREVERVWQEAGFKFILAGGPHLFRKNGHLLDWHNINNQPGDDSLPKLWNTIGNGKRVAWYASQHVGAEDPAFNRRQNGLAAWLAGYTALCNYAHHFGPYNDDSVTYKPMVYAYGISGGVLDTLQWEGFREGIDDIRYGTLFVELAREAEKSDDINVRRLGMKAMHFLSLVDRDKDDLNEVRAEMMKFIAQMRNELGKGEETEQCAMCNVQCAISPDGANNTPAETNSLTRKLENSETEQNSALRTPHSALTQPWNVGSIIYGRYAEAEPVFDELYKKVKTDGKPLQFGLQRKDFKLYNRGVTPLRAGRDIKWVLGKYDELKEIVDYALSVTTNMPPADVFELKLSVAAAPLSGTPKEIADKLTKIEPALAEGVAPKDRAEVIRNCASVAGAAGNENLVRGFKLYLDTVSPEKPKLVFKVKYSAHRVTGPDSWNQLDVEPETQLMARDYGGGREFFITDVSTGDRGSTGEGEMKTRPSISIICDDWGIHFRFSDPDPKSREIEMGLVPGGSYECYIAPGEGKPYTCFLMQPDDTLPYIWNSLYDCPGHRRIDPKDPKKMTSKTLLGENGIDTYVSFSWDNWADQIPHNGSRWDFESVRWGRAGSAAWNGLKSVHGRSSWGELEFEIPESGYISILKRRIIQAKNEYVTEKTASRYKTGLFDHWKDSDLGDPQFYTDCLADIEQELDSFAAKVTPEMTDEDILFLAKNALSKWLNLKYEVARLRTEYLNRK